VEICTVGSVRGESVGAAMVDLNGHEAGNGGYSQGRPTARWVLLYSERCPIIPFVLGPSSDIAIFRGYQAHIWHFGLYLHWLKSWLL
jgi:hypothetical protein